jgi:hypothetical protein
MQLFSKREKINRDTFNADFNQNFYDGTKSFKTSTRSLEQIGKDLNVVSLTTNRIIDKCMDVNMCKMLSNYIFTNVLY